MIHAFPLTVLPLFAYNLVGYSLSGADPWATEIFAVTMLSGARWSMGLGDLLIVFAIVMLFFEVRKAARTSGKTVLNRTFSTIVLIVYLIEFIAVGVAANALFFTLTTIALFDVVASFSIRAAQRYIVLDQNAEENF